MTIGTSYSFTCDRSRSTFHNMMMRTTKSDVSDTDVSPKKMKISKKPHCYLTNLDKIARSYQGARYALTAQCRLFRSDAWRYCRGRIPSKLHMSAVMKIYAHRHTDSTQQSRLRSRNKHFPWRPILARFCQLFYRNGKTFLELHLL